MQKELLSSFSEALSNADTEAQPLPEEKQVAPPTPMDIFNEAIEKPQESPLLDATQSRAEELAITQGLGTGSLPPFQESPVKFPNTELRERPGLFSNPFEFNQRVIDPTLQTGVAFGKYLPIVGQGLATSEATGMIGRQALGQTFPDAGFEPVTNKEVFGKALEVGGEAIGGAFIDDLIKKGVNKELLKKTAQSGLAGFSFGAGASLQQNESYTEAFLTGLKQGAVSSAIPSAFKTGAYIQERIMPTMKQLQNRIDEVDYQRKKFTSEVLPETSKEGEEAVGYGFTRTIDEAANAIKKAESFEEIEMNFLQIQEKAMQDLDSIISRTSNPKLNYYYLAPLFEEVQELSKDAQFTKEAADMWEILMNEITNSQNKGGYTLKELQERKKFWNKKLGGLSGSTDEATAAKERAFDLLREGARMEVASVVGDELGEAYGKQVNALNMTYGGLNDAVIVLRKQKTKTRERPTPTKMQELIGIVTAPFRMIKGGLSFDELSRTKRIGDILGTRTGDIEKLRQKSESIQKQLREKQRRVLIKQQAKAEKAGMGSPEQMAGGETMPKKIDDVMLKGEPDIPFSQSTTTQTIAEAKSSGQSFDEWMKGQGEKLYQGGGKEIKVEDRVGGVYLTKSKEYANKFSNGKGVAEGYANPKKPYDLTDQIANQPERELLIEAPQNFQSEIKSLREKGYDAITYKDQVLVLDPKIVKTRSELKAEWDKY